MGTEGLLECRRACQAARDVRGAAPGRSCCPGFAGQVDGVTLGSDLCGQVRRLSTKIGFSASCKSETFNGFLVVSWL
jgi:hypothetical protein